MPFWQIAGVVLSAVGLLGQGQAQRVQRRYQADVAKANAKSAEMEAQYAEEIAGSKEAAHRRKVQRLQASQRAAQASSGFLVGQGTFGDILEDTSTLGELDALAIRHDGAIAAWRARESARASSAQASLYNARDPSATIAAGGSLLTDLYEAGAFSKKAPSNAAVSF